MGKSLVVSSSSLTLDNNLIKQIYQHVTFLANFRYKNAITVLQSRHVGYETEDFVQETVQEVAKQFKTKKFKTINHLKKFINFVMEFHYLKEKRRLFYTKSRGKFTCVSLEEDINDYRKIEDTLSCQMSTSDLDLHSLLGKNLYISYNWKAVNIITKKDFHKESSLVFSVNKFIETQMINGLKETCRLYKDSGFYMTKAIFDKFSQAIIDYAKANDLLAIDNSLDTKYVYHRKTSEFTEEKFMHLAKTCMCGHENKDLSIYDTTWQCPECGRIHDRNSLVKFNSGLLTSYNPYVANIEVSELKEDKILIGI